MKLEISKNELMILVKNQIKNLFMLNNEEEKIIDICVEVALEKANYSFSHLKVKYYHKNGEVYFNPFHGSQYTIFLYYLSKAVFQNYPERSTLADRVYYLNKALNSVDLFYQVELPDIFFLDHPFASVMGRAKYGNFFTFAQNCTVGNNKGIFPIIGDNVRLSAGVTILGKCNIGDNVTFSANTYVKDTDIPSGSIVFGTSPNLVIKSKESIFFNNPLIDYKNYELELFKKDRKQENAV